MNKILKWIIAALMFAYSILMLIQISHKGLFCITDSLCFDDPIDLANVILLIVCAIIPFHLLSMINKKHKSKPIYFTPIISLIIIVLFPLPIEGRTQFRPHETNSSSVDQANKNYKETDVWFGFKPFWNRQTIRESSKKYNQFSLSGTQRSAESGNIHLHYTVTKYKLQKIEISATNNNPNQFKYKNECIFERKTQILGFYWRDQRMSVNPKNHRKKDNCKRIENPF